jgi:hypothetical protein
LGAYDGGLSEVLSEILLEVLRKITKTLKILVILTGGFRTGDIENRSQHYTTADRLNSVRL